MSLSKIIQSTVAAAALAIGSSTKASPIIVTVDNSVQTAQILQGISADATTVRAAANGLTYNFNNSLTSSTTNINSGNVMDLATGLSTNTQTAQQFGTGGIYGYNNSQPTLPVLTYNGPANSLGVGGSVFDGTTTFQSFLDNTGTLKLLDFSNGTTTSLWTLPSTSGVTGLDTVLRNGGNASNPSDYISFVTKSDGSFNAYNTVTGSSLGSFVFDGVSSVGSLTDIGFNRTTGTIYGSLAGFDNTGYIISSNFGSNFNSISASAVPEPGTSALLMGGAAALLYLINRRRKK